MRYIFLIVLMFHSANANNWFIAKICNTNIETVQYWKKQGNSCMSNLKKSDSKIETLKSKLQNLSENDGDEENKRVQAITDLKNQKAIISKELTDERDKNNRLNSIIKKRDNTIIELNKEIRRLKAQKTEGCKRYSLTINPRPKDAKVYIMGIDHNYKNGIKLEANSYSIKVKLDGYQTKILDINLDSDKNIDIILEKVSKGKWNPLIYKGKRSYSKNSSNTVLDNYTGLIWQKNGSINGMKWQEAKSHCSNLNMRLPTYNELYYLADRDSKKVLDSNYFKTDTNWYWTDTEYSDDITQAWVVNFSSGFDNWLYKARSYFVRCVR